MMTKLLFIIFLFKSFTCFAMDIDAKFKARLLSHSTSKRTILLNKGHEIDLKMGDHCKISTPEGLIARAVLIKISPSRSVWSIYRTYSKDKIKNNLAVTVKISSPAKLTEDESRNLGAFAKETFKEEEPTTTKLSQADKDLEKYFDKALITVGTSADKNIDFSTLEDKPDTVKPNPDVDFSLLDGRGDEKSRSQHVDFSSLR